MLLTTNQCKRFASLSQSGQLSVRLHVVFTATLNGGIRDGKKGRSVDGHRGEKPRAFFKESWRRVMRQNTARPRKGERRGGSGDAGGPVRGSKNSRLTGLVDVPEFRTAAMLGAEWDAIAHYRAGAREMAKKVRELASKALSLGSRARALNERDATNGAYRLTAGFRSALREDGERRRKAIEGDPEDISLELGNCTG